MTTSTISMHPIIGCYYTQFTDNYPQAPGICTGNMDTLTIGSQLDVSGGYFVCANAIKKNVNERISFTGPGLVAGRTVEFEAPIVEFVGTEQEPVTIIGLEKISITATQAAKIKHLTIKMLESAQLSFKIADFSSFESVRVVRMSVEGKNLIETTQFDWKNRKEFLESSKSLQETS